MDWVGEITVEGGAVEGDEIVIGEIGPFSEHDIVVTGKVTKVGEFLIWPSAQYADAIGNRYQIAPDEVQVTSRRKLIYLLLPFLVSAAAGVGIAGVYFYETRFAQKIKGRQIGSIAVALVAQVEEKNGVAPSFAHRKWKLSLAELSYLLSWYVTRANATSVARAERTNYKISHPKSRLVPGQDFKNLVVVKEAYLLLAQMIRNRVKSSDVVPPTFLVQGFKVGLADIAYMLSLAVIRAREGEALPRGVRIMSSTQVLSEEDLGEEDTITDQPTIEEEGPAEADSEESEVEVAEEPVAGTGEVSEDKESQVVAQEKPKEEIGNG
jgi:hypothetical protein